ncbi:MAG: glutamate racemase [Chloroflexota bacterium]
MADSTDSRPIGMLDSGVGGLSVLREVRQLLPSESVIYVGDQGHLPYGPRPREEIRSFVSGIIQFLLDQNCKLIVIPCNAACAAALHYARTAFPAIPIVGMEPAIKPAAEHTKTGVIGVITTKATYQGELFASVLDRFANGIQVETQVCPELVLLVEQGAPDTPQSQAIVAGYLDPLKATGIDELVLGCTHFPFLDKQIRAQLGSDIEIIDPAPAVARQLGRVLAQRQLAHPAGAVGQVRYLTTGDADHMRFLIKTLLHEAEPAVEAVQWHNDRSIEVVRNPV